MPTWIVGLFNMLLGGVASIIKAMGPPAIVVESEKAGAAQANVATAEADATSEAAVAQAVVQGPKTQADVVNRLNEGTF